MDGPRLVRTGELRSGRRAIAVPPGSNCSVPQARFTDSAQNRSDFGTGFAVRRLRFAEPSAARGPGRVDLRSMLLLVGERKLLANGRGRWLAVLASVVLSAAVLYAQGSHHAEGTSPPLRAANPPPTPTVQAFLPAAAPHVASPAEVEKLAGNAPAATPMPFELPPGVAPENGLQTHTIRVARAISVLFPEITTIGGYRQDALKWHPNGLAIDVMIPNPDSPEGIELGNQIAGFALANAKRWGIDDVIWRHAIYLGADKGHGCPRWAQQPPTTSTTFISPPTVADIRPGMRSTTSDPVHHTDRLAVTWTGGLLRPRPAVGQFAGRPGRPVGRADEKPFGHLGDDPRAFQLTVVVDGRLSRSG